MIRRLLLSSSTRLGGLQVAVLCVSLFSQIYIARTFGVGRELDGYYAVLGTALGLMGAVSVGINYLLPPKIVRALARNDSFGAKQVAGESGFRFLVWIMVIAGLGAGGMLLAAKFGWRAAGQPGYQVVALGWTVAAGSAIAGLLGAISNAYRKVALPLAASVLPPAMLIMVLSTGAEPGIATMFVGTLAGTAFQCLALAASLRHLVAWGAGPLDNSRDSSRLFMAMSGAACFSSYAVVDAFVAPTIGEGALTLQALGQRLIVAFGAVLSAGAFALAPDNFGRLVERGLARDAYRLFLRNAAILIALALCAAALTPLLGGYVLRVLFVGGNFRLESIEHLARLVTILLLGCGAMLSTAIGFRLLYSLSADVYVTAASLAWLAVYLISSLGFVRLGLPYPLGWAYVVSWWLILVWLALFVDRRTSDSVPKQWLESK